MRALSPYKLVLYLGSLFAPRARARLLYFPPSLPVSCFAIFLSAVGLGLNATSALSADSKKPTKKSTELSRALPFDFTGSARAAPSAKIYSPLNIDQKIRPTFTDGTRPFYLPPHATLLPKTPVQNLKNKIVEPLTLGVEADVAVGPKEDKQPSIALQPKRDNEEPLEKALDAPRTAAKSSNSEKSAADAAVVGAINQFDSADASIAGQRNSTNAANNQRETSPDLSEEKKAKKTVTAQTLPSPKASKTKAASEHQLETVEAKNKMEATEQTKTTDPTYVANAAPFSQTPDKGEFNTRNSVELEASGPSPQKSKEPQQANNTTAAQTADTRTQSQVSFTSARINDGSSIRRPKSGAPEASAIETAVSRATSPEAIETASLSPKKQVTTDSSTSLSLVPLPEAKPRREELAKKAAARKRVRRLTAARRRAAKRRKKPQAPPAQPVPTGRPAWASSALGSTN